LCQEALSRAVHEPQLAILVQREDRHIDLRHHPAKER
jgi:hypothetical protein